MEFIFMSGADVAFFRSDATKADWTQEELNLNCTFPYMPDKEIHRGMTVLFQDPATNDWQAYEIRQCQMYTDYQQFEAEDIAVSELTDCHIPNETELDNVTAKAALTNILSGTGWKVGTVSDNPVSSGDITRGSVWQNVSVITQNWNVYIMSRVKVDSTGITARYLDILPSAGTDRGLRLAINKNISDPVVTYDDSELYTALFGYGASYSVGSGSAQETKEYDFSSVVWNKTNDHPAKPAGQKYLEWPEMTALYGRNGKPRFGYYQNTQIKDPAVLLQKTWETLKICASPKISITGTVTDLKRCGYKDVPLRLHDMAIVEIEPYGIQVYKQVIRLTVDLLDPTKNLPTIGDYIPNIIYINRETEDFATGGGRGAGGGSGSSKTDVTESEFKTRIYDTGQQVGMLAEHVNEHGQIFSRAGMHIDPDTGVLIYADDGDLQQIGSLFHVQKDMIQTEVYDRKNADNQLTSRITQTANQISLEVSERKSADAGLSGRITTQADRISLVVEGTGANAHIKAAQIVASINEAGSSVLISANHIRLDGNTTVAGMLGIENGGLKVKGSAFIQGNLTMGNGTEIIGSNYRVGGSLYFSGSSPGSSYTLTGTDVKNMLVSAVVEGNVLTLTDHSGNEVTFSKATSLSDEWSGNTYTVTAKQNNVTVGTKSVSPYVQPVGSQGGVYVDVYVATGSSGSAGYDTHGNARKLYLVKSGLNVYLKSENSTSSGTVYAQITADNPYPTSMTIRQISGYSGARRIKLYYTDNTVTTIPSGFHEASGGSTYWYHSGTDLNQTGSNKTVHY